MPQKSTKITNTFSLILSLLCLFVAGVSGQQTVDPAAWGGNHVGKPILEYVHGDECLFCHRNTIGVTWQKNAHGLTVRQGEDAPELQTLAHQLPELSSVVNEIGYFLGSRHRVRFLKKNGYGKFSLMRTRIPSPHLRRAQSVM